MTVPARSEDTVPLSAGATALAPPPARPGPARRARPARPAAKAPAAKAGAPQPARAAAPAPTAPARTLPARTRPAPASDPAALPVSPPRPRALAMARGHRAPFVVLLLVLMGGGLLCLLLLNTALSENAFHAHALQAQASKLADAEQELDLKSDKIAAPAELAARASALHMVPGGMPTPLPPDAPVPPGARLVTTGPDGAALYSLPSPAPRASAAATPTASRAASPPAHATGTPGR